MLSAKNKRQFFIHRGFRVVFLFYLIQLSFAANAMMFTIPRTKAASYGTTLPSESNGQRSRAMRSSIRPRSF